MKKQNLNFKKMTVEDLQNLRNEYSDKVSDLMKEFADKTGLRIITIECEDVVTERWHCQIWVPV